ncbi:glycosyltransferase family 4 protein [Psychrobacter sp. T6-6]|uniref:glycosyltransferase family 4 protein n=1 Tax=Psychrobacter sp. T6-6 TaxID=3457452 RepID=UPI003FD03271
MKIVHIITGLDNGGAEGVLYRLVTHDTENEHIVISMMDAGKYGPLLLAKGISVHFLDMKSGKASLLAVIKLYKQLKNINPDIVQTWMYHADLIGGLTASIAGVKKIYWNIRQSNFDSSHTKLSTIKIANVCSKLSSTIPTKIISCSTKAVDEHIKLGYDKEKIVVIGNGYDLSIFKPDNSVCEEFRNTLGIGQFPVLGMVGRYDPQKDHENLIQALSVVYSRGYKFDLLLVGKNLNEDNIELLSIINKYDLNNSIHLLDQRSDIQSIMNALDIHILSSAYGEGFPNVVAEAMACNTPCIVTDVGDSKLIVDKYGIVIEPRSTSELVEAIITLMNAMSVEEEWAKLKEECSTHIGEHFSIEAMVSKYKEVWNY